MGISFDSQAQWAILFGAILLLLGYVGQVAAVVAFILAFLRVSKERRVSKKSALLLVVGIVGVAAFVAARVVGVLTW